MLDILSISFAVFLFVLCAVLLALEIFIPSMGLLTVLALICLTAGIALFFQISIPAGWVGIWTAVVLIPISLIIMYKLFTKTWIGKAFILKKVNRNTGDAIQDYNKIQLFVGCEGFVESPLRPVGICLIDNLRVSCIAETGFLEKGEKVKVIKVEGNKIIVRKINAKGESDV